jgi:tetratricopeptide (TPR) repeat protein
MRPILLHQRKDLYSLIIAGALFLLINNTFAQADRILAVHDSIRRAFEQAKGNDRFPLMIIHGGVLLRSDTATAYKLINQGIEESAKIQDHQTVLLGYHNLIAHYNGIGNFSKAIQLVEIKINYEKVHGLKVSEGFSYINWARQYISQNRYDSALIKIDVAKRIFEQLENLKGLSVVYDVYGLINIYQGNYKIGNTYYFKALEYANQTDSAYFKGVVNYHLGLSYSRTADYDLASFYIHKAIEHWAPLHSMGLAPKWNAAELLGNLYLKLKRYDLALEYHREALRIRELNYKGAYPDSTNLSYAYSYNNIAEVYYLTHQLDSAFWYAIESLKIKLRPATAAKHDEIGNSYLNTAKILLKMDSLVQADSLGRMALKSYELAKWNDGLAESYSLLADIALAKNQKLKALAYLEKSLALSHKIGAKQLEIGILKKIAPLQLELGNIKAANNSYQKYIALNDSVFNSDMNQKVAEMNVKYETEKKEIENQFLKSGLDAQKKTQKYLLASQAMSLAFILAMIAFVIALRKNLKNKNKQLNHKEEINQLLRVQYQKDLDYKNRELEMMVETIKNKNEMLETIRSIMLEEIKQNCNAPVETFHRTVKTIQSHMTADQNWELLERQIHELSADFREKMLNKHPHLTPNDFKLLTYLKLKLPQREIAALMNITEDSVRKQKYRLRKKLNLNGEDLESYLNSV